MWCHQQLHCIFLSRSLNCKQAPCLAVQSSTPSKTGTLLYHVNLRVINLRGIKIQKFEAAGFLTRECCLHEPFAYLGSSTRTWLPYQVFLHSNFQVPSAAAQPTFGITPGTHSSQVAILCMVCDAGSPPALIMSSWSKTAIVFLSPSADGLLALHAGSR